MKPAGRISAERTASGKGKMNTKLTAWAAYQAGKLALPPGYKLEHDADVLYLQRDDGSVVATFSARGVAPAEVAKTAEEDHRARGKSSA
jgi:hypothetical protein